ncbi:hypothetical protein [Bizionia arctica]|uniref:Uncharacterized protein n=1 Tax=Bizionia arctica TaxID=1495645 RepID=A0A917LN86_9FLAO|nr:hypothetical protein [Bizionia arctica]GGG44762.1 hypothetical protein GCM10010976_15470 [Bizionia arctica]
MNDNIYIDKFQKKTDSELEAIIEHKEKYNDEALLATIEVLKSRNRESAIFETIETEIQLSKENEILAQKLTIEEDKKNNNISDNSTAPELYSKRVIMVFSVLFSTIFGAVLLMANLKQTGNTKGQMQVLIFGVLYTIGSVVIIDLLKIQSNLGIIFNFVGVGILTEYFWNKYIGKEVEHKNRSWIKPAIISVLITIPLMLIIIYGQ